MPQPNYFKKAALGFAKGAATAAWNHFSRKTLAPTVGKVWRKISNRPLDSDPAGVSQTIPGYATKRVIYRARHRKGWRGRRKRTKRFISKVEHALESTLMQKNSYNQVNSARYNSGTGTQSVNTFLHQNSYEDLNSILATCQGSGPGGSWTGATQLSVLPAQKFSITSYVATMTFKNQTNANAFLDLYTVVPRTDLSNNPASNCMGVGFIDQGNTNSVANVVGSTPYQCAELTSNYKILRKVRYSMAPGAVETVEYNDRRRYQIQNERIQRIPASSSTFRGLSKQWLGILWGEPINDSTVKTNVTTANVALDVVTTETYWFSFMAENLNRVFYGNNLASITSGSSVLVDTGATVTPSTS